MQKIFMSSSSHKAPQMLKSSKLRDGSKLSQLFMLKNQPNVSLGVPNYQSQYASVHSHAPISEKLRCCKPVVALE